MSHILAVIDTETTGLSDYKQDVWQVAGHILLVKDKKYEKIESFDLKMCPIDLNAAMDKALEIGHTTREELKKFPASSKALAKFTEILEQYISKFNKKDKMHLVAYNAPFDERFLRSWFRKNGSNFYGSYFWMPSIDVMTLAGAKLLDDRPDMVNFKLGAVAEQLGIKVEAKKQHDAMYDVELTWQMYEKMFGLTEQE